MKSNAIMFFLLLSFSIVCSLKSKNKRIMPKTPAHQNIKPNNVELTVSNSKSDSSLLSFFLKNTDIYYSLGLIENEFVLTSQQDDIIKISEKNNDSLNNQHKFETIINGENVLTNSLNVEGSLLYRNYPQWKMVKYDSFFNNMTSLGWDFDKVTTCGNNYHMLGGHCQVSNGLLSKVYKNLPPHRLVRVEALFHFIGDWDNHTGYLKENDRFLWSSRCKTNQDNEFKNQICGYTVCKIGEVISVTFDHNESELNLVFGTTLGENACVQSFGISDVKIYIK
jgi:hypothetical protein